MLNLKNASKAISRNNSDDAVRQRQYLILLDDIIAQCVNIPCCADKEELLIELLKTASEIYSNINYRELVTKIGTLLFQHANPRLDNSMCLSEIDSIMRENIHGHWHELWLEAKCPLQGCSTPKSYYKKHLIVQQICEYFERHKLPSHTTKKS